MNAISRSETLHHPALRESQGPVFDARLLVGDNATARIVLDGKVYVLRITKTGKLILTK